MPQAEDFLLSFQLDKDFKLPKNTVAEIVPVSLLGGMKVSLFMAWSGILYEVGDTIPGRLAESITDRIEAELIPVKEKISNLIVVTRFGYQFGR